MLNWYEFPQQKYPCQPFAKSITFGGNANYWKEWRERSIKLILLPYLIWQAVDPLVLGKARSKAMLLRDGYYADTPKSNCDKVATMLVHGDAAFAGQGIVSYSLYPSFSFSNCI